jgi:hypothetical protein
MTINSITVALENAKPRSAWSRGVQMYAFELLHDLGQAITDGYFSADDLEDSKKLEVQLLNGARSWSDYSWGGSSFIYDSDIADRLCTPSELKKTRGGERRPNSREEWLDVQARALSQAARHIIRAASGRVVIM